MPTSGQGQWTARLSLGSTSLLPAGWVAAGEEAPHVPGQQRTSAAS